MNKEEKLCAYLNHLVEGRENYKEHARQLALYLDLTEVEELIHEEKYEEALEIVEEYWIENSYEREMEELI